MKAALMTIACIAFTGVEAQQNQTQTLFRVQSRYDPLAGVLLYEKIDLRGNTVQRIEQYYPTPPIARCNLTLWSNIQQSLLNSQISLPS